MKTKIFWLGLFLLGACTGGQHIFYWDRPETGSIWFAKDHAECIHRADYWPYVWKWPWEWSLTERRKYNLRFDNDAGNGIWAQYVGIPGTQPVYVNALYGDWSVSADKYRECMLNRGYKEVYPSVQNRQVFPE